MRHKHRFVAIPITGLNAWNGDEALLGWKVQCQHCHKDAKPGDIIEEIESSWWHKLIPQAKLVHIVMPQTST